MKAAGHSDEYEDETYVEAVTVEKEIVFNEKVCRVE
jgi:hypothetical protein